MDPRHPEVAITRIDQLVNQFKGIIDKINIETTSSRLGGIEREGALVVQEICLVAPRLHEAMMQASRQRRHELTRGVVENPVEMSHDGYLSVDEVIEEIPTPANQAETVIVEPKPRKKKTSKKKKAE